MFTERSILLIYLKKEIPMDLVFDGSKYRIDTETLNELTSMARGGWLDTMTVGVDGESYGVMSIRDIKIHPYVFKLTPPMSNDEFNDLVADIAKNSQLVPVKIWRKAGTHFVVDGRNRINALRALGIEYVKFVYEKITNLDELETKIISWDKRRHTSKSQKAVAAFFDYEANGGPMRGYAEKYGVATGYISQCSKISKMKYGGRVILEELFKNREAEVGGKRCSSLTQIIRELERMERANESESERVPDRYSSISSGLRDMRQNLDIEALAYTKKVVSRLIDEVNREM
jgi:hypothetical protein